MQLQYNPSTSCALSSNLPSYVPMRLGSFVRDLAGGNRTPDIKVAVHHFKLLRFVESIWLRTSQSSVSLLNQSFLSYLENSEAFILHLVTGLVITSFISTIPTEFCSEYLSHDFCNPHFCGRLPFPKKIPCHKVNHHFDESADVWGYFPWPNHWRDEVMWCNLAKAHFSFALVFFSRVQRASHFGCISIFSGQHRPDKEWLNLVTIDSQEIILIQRLLFSWQSWYDACSLWIACTLWTYRKHIWDISGSKWYKTWRQSNSQTKISAHEHFRNTY